MPHAVPTVTTKAARRIVKIQTRASIPRHILECLPDPPEGPPPALSDRSAWIRSLEPWRRDKIRPAGRHAYAIPHSQATITPELRTAGAAREPQSTSDDSGDVFGLSTSSASEGEVFSGTGSPYVVPPRTDGVAGWVASLQDSGTHTSDMADPALPLGDAMIGQSPATPASLRRRLSDNGSSNSFRRPVIARRDSAAAILAPSRSSIVLDASKEWDLEFASTSCDSGREADDEGSNYPSTDSDSLSGPSDVSSCPTDAFASSIDSLDLIEWEYSKATWDDQDGRGCHRLPGTKDASPNDHSADSVQRVADDATVDRSRDNTALHDVAIPPTEDVAIHGRDVIFPSVRAATASPEHKQLLCFLSEWAAQYVWKVVTTGSGISAAYRGYHLSEHPGFPAEPPSYLADAIKGCLLATLLQPSAIFLALWYIVRLPVYIGEAAYEPDTSAYHFRRVLLGEGVVPFGTVEKQSLELYAPFKLFVNGILLASKTLDDHTYSNRCWHEVSRIQIRDINALELYSLDLLHFDLTVPRDAWVQWLTSLRVHHRASAPYPTPIGPIRETPHSIILHLLDRLITTSTSEADPGSVAPIFFGVDERAKVGPLSQVGSDSEWDPDDYGPMKDEYRFRKLTAIRPPLPTPLPPPAAWTPSADPPLDVNRPRPRYLAVQKSPCTAAAQPVDVLPFYPFSHPRAMPTVPSARFDAFPASGYHHGLCIPTPLHPLPYFIPYHYPVPVGGFGN